MSDPKKLAKTYTSVWDTQRGKDVVSKGYPTSRRELEDGRETRFVECGFDDEYAPWSDREMWYAMEVLKSGDTEIQDPPEPELPSNMCALHSDAGEAIDGTESIT